MIPRAATLEEVAAVLGVSRQRVQQLEAQALQKARRVLERRGIQPEHFLDLWRAEAGGRASQRPGCGDAL